MVVVLLIASLLWFERSAWGSRHWDAFKLRIPLKIGDVVQKVAIARWSRTFSSHRGRRSDHPGDRDHGQDRRQRRDRGRDGIGDRVGQVEPAMIILAGSIVAVIGISMYLPLFDVYNQIK